LKKREKIVKNFFERKRERRGGLTPGHAKREKGEG
jgi:hypothetical protein